MHDFDEHDLPSGNAALDKLLGGDRAALFTFDENRQPEPISERRARGQVSDGATPRAPDFSREPLDGFQGVLTGVPTFVGKSGQLLGKR
jgi:hypothetical protein